MHQSPTGPQPARLTARPGKARAEADFRKRWPSNQSYSFFALLGVIQTEHGNAGLPDNRESRNMLIVIADIAWHYCKRPVEELQRVVPTYARWCDVNALIDYVEAQANERGRALTAKEASTLIGFTYERWKRAPRKPFDPCDKTPGQMDAIRRKIGAASSRAYRARRKAERKPKPTPELVKHLMATHGISRRTAYYWIECGGEQRVIIPKPKPWEAFGYSRATWHRRGKPAPGETGDCTKPVMDGETGICTNHSGSAAPAASQDIEAIEVSSGETVSLHKMRHDLSVLVLGEGMTGGEIADATPTSVPPDGLGGHRRLAAEESKEVAVRRYEVCGRPVLTVHTTRVERKDTREAARHDGPRHSWMSISDPEERRRAIFAKAEADLRAIEAKEARLRTIEGRAA